MLLYESEYRTLTKEQVGIMKTAEMHFLRAVAGYRMTDHKHAERTIK